MESRLRTLTIGGLQTVIDAQQRLSRRPRDYRTLEFALGKIIHHAPDITNTPPPMLRLIASAHPRPSND